MRDVRFVQVAVVRLLARKDTLGEILNRRPRLY